jgi:hypothetical protein
MERISNGIMMMPPFISKSKKFMDAWVSVAVVAATFAESNITCKSIGVYF